MAALMARKDDLAKAGIIIEPDGEYYKASAKKVDWTSYRAEHH